jgi:hypothetical protein
MDADEDGGTLATRPVIFDGSYLYVNVAADAGELRAEVLDEAGQVIEPFNINHSQPVSTDSTIVRMSWEGAEDLSALSGRPVRFRFHLTNGSLYAFWVSPEESGASHGYVGAGGPGFTTDTDSVGIGAYEVAAQQ